MASHSPKPTSSRSRRLPDPASLSVPMARFALFVVYGWFGLLKVLGQSPAGGLVHALHEATIPFVDFDTFFAAFGSFELMIGVLCLFPGATSVALALLATHVATTILPLFVLPHVAWQQFLVPTLEGQYIIKNLLIVAAAVTIAGGRQRSARASVGAEDARPESALRDGMLAPREVAPVTDAAMRKREVVGR